MRSRNTTRTATYYGSENTRDGLGGRMGADRSRRETGERAAADPRWCAARPASGKIEQKEFLVEASPKGDSQTRVFEGFGRGGHV